MTWRTIRIGLIVLTVQFVLVVIATRRNDFGRIFEEDDTPGSVYLFLDGASLSGKWSSVCFVTS